MSAGATPEEKKQITEIGERLEKLYPNLNLTIWGGVDDHFFLSISFPTYENYSINVFTSQLRNGGVEGNVNEVINKINELRNKANRLLFDTDRDNGVDENSYDKCL
jgi:hypothetical protein